MVKNLEHLYLPEVNFKTDLKIRAKRVWQSYVKAPKKAHPKTPLETPVTFVYSSFSPNSPGCVNRNYIKDLGPRPTTLQVLNALKSLQFTDYKRFHPDIRYNFMIGGDGVVYQGRGWTYCSSLPSRHISNHTNSIFIGFIGYWHDEPPDEKLFKLRDELVKIGVHRGAINKKHLHVTLAFPSVYRMDFEAYVK